MAPEREKRKLAAVLVTDMVGYSRLMEADERGTIARQKAHRKELIDPEIAEHNGRIVKTTGDGLLVEFASVVDATECAVAIQRAMAEREADLPKDRRIVYRVGINLGDIVIDEEDIYGDGVNIAARLEELAEPGGVSISGTCYDQLKQKVDVGYEFLGEQKVKNIQEPVRVYRVLVEPEAAGKVIGERRLKLGPWHPWAPDVEPVRSERMAFPLPERPSIAVLPIDNLSGDPEQEYLADGIAENIITTLSKIPGMFVIDRNSTFTYKGKPVKVQEVAEELGVRYVLEGSVQRSGDRVRVTAQLIDALTGAHLWAERYDRDLADIFALQDDITEKVVVATEVTVGEGEDARIWRRQTDNADAYVQYLRGLERWRRFTKADNAEAQRLLESVVALDPNFGAALVDLARTHYFGARFSWSDDPTQSIARAYELTERALAIDDSDAWAHLMLGNLAMLKGQHKQAEAYCDKAIDLGPTSQVLALCARNFVYWSRPAEALQLIERAMRLSPYYPDWYLSVFGSAHCMLGNLETALEACTRGKDRNPDAIFVYVDLAIVYGMMGRGEDAETAIQELLLRHPGFSLRTYKKMAHYSDPAEWERISAELRKAGLPE